MKALSKLNITILLSIFVVLPICNSSGNVNDTIPIESLTPSTIIPTSISYPETLLYSFDSESGFESGGNNGTTPNSVIQGSDGNLYGTTQGGGVYSAGTVFKITPQGVESPETTLLYSFGYGNDGTTPNSLIQGSDGNFYGTTQTGGGGRGGYGTVFQVTPQGQETVLYRFGVDGAITDGIQPNSLIQGSDGNLYGTTAGNTASGGAYETVFQVTPQGQYTLLYRFTDGAQPNSVIQGSDGNLYGTTLYGGNGNGTVFKLTPQGQETTLYQFTGAITDGAQPNSIIQGSDGNFYGTTQYGSGYHYGTVFKLTPQGQETTLYQFTVAITDGAQPNSVIQGSDGNFYGTTQQGGRGYGTVFKLTTPTPQAPYQILYNFTGGSDGAYPNGVIQGGYGNFYGTTQQGGRGYGTVFKLTPHGVQTTLYSFGGAPDGYYPQIGVIQGNDGNFYGTTQYGGVYNAGTVFKITPQGVESPIYSFTGGNDGTTPNSLIQGSDGNFYGTTPYRGVYNAGTVFKITPQGVESPGTPTLYSFTGGNDGIQPNSLIQGSDGNFYGTTQYGGVYNAGTVFKLTPQGVESPIYSFGNGNGTNPNSLIQGSDGNLYGTTQYGGNGNGTIFKVTPQGQETTLYQFTGANNDGTYPNSIIQASDGNFYGTTQGGGNCGYQGCGTVFKLTPQGVKTTLHSFVGGTYGTAPNSLIQGWVDGNLYGTTYLGGSDNGTVFKLTPQ